VLTERSDRDLALAVLDRDRKAAAEFVEMYADEIYTFVWSRLAPRLESVDDLVQETFLSAWRGLKTYSGESPLRQWLLSIARNKVNDHYRQAFRRSWDSLDAVEGSIPEGSESVEHVLLAAEREQQVARAFEAMRPEYAMLLRWRYWDRQPVRQMAQEIGKTEKAVERMLARAKEEFRGHWSRMGGE
jgi:RNA polymerase sigma-70 factor (ECF subfamily)